MGVGVKKKETLVNLSPGGGGRKETDKHTKYKTFLPTFVWGESHVVSLSVFSMRETRNSARDGKYFTENGGKAEGGKIICSTRVGEEGKSDAFFASVSFLLRRRPSRGAIPRSLGACVYVYCYCCGGSAGKRCEAQKNHTSHSMPSSFQTPKEEESACLINLSAQDLPNEKKSELLQIIDSGAKVSC